MNEAVCLCVEVDQARIERPHQDALPGPLGRDLDQALNWVTEAQKTQQPLSVGLLGNCADVLPELVRRKITPDVLTDQTLGPRRPARLRAQQDPVRAGAEAARIRPGALHRRVDAFHGGSREGHARDAARGGRSLSTMATTSGGKHSRPGWITPSISKASCRSSSGRSSAKGRGLSVGWHSPVIRKTIARTDRAVLGTFPENEHLCRWIRLAQEQVAFQGLPSRICWLGYGERAKMGLVFNDLVAKGEISAPIALGRDHLDCGSVASPNRETEGMKDGSDAIADWPILNALLNTACGASWVSVHHGGVSASVIPSTRVRCSWWTARPRPPGGSSAYSRPTLLPESSVTPTRVMRRPNALRKNAA